MGGDRKMVRTISTFRRGLTFVRTYLNKDIALSHLAIFIEVCLNGGITMSDLADKLELPQASISRSTKELSKYIEKDPKTGEKKLAGYDLIRTEPDLEERRRLVLYLTSKGKQIKELLEKYMEEEG
jgi:DNA-binding MarR family transcriptional regulator